MRVFAMLHISFFFFIVFLFRSSTFVNFISLISIAGHMHGLIIIISINILFLTRVCSCVGVCVYVYVYLRVTFEFLTKGEYKTYIIIYLSNYFVFIRLRQLHNSTRLIQSISLMCLCSLSFTHHTEILLLLYASFHFTFFRLRPR